MKIKDLISHLESVAPPSLQESYDNSGLIVGSKADEVNKALICLDSTEEVVDEAITNKCQLIIAHHPIVFSGLKRFNGTDYVQKTIIKAIQNKIAIYAIHTNLDNVSHGVNHKIGKRLGLINTTILSKKQGQLKKLITFCPTDRSEKVREALFAAGAGTIGAYDQCSFNTEGYGTFRGSENTSPYVGEIGKQHRENETKIEVIFPIFKQQKVVAELLKSHPYEEVAYDIIALENESTQYGSGMIGELKKPLPTREFLAFLKLAMNTPCIRYTKATKESIKKVAVCGGSGSFLLPNAIAVEADIFITSDFKYHQFFDANNQLVIADIGHYESEQFTVELINDIIKEKFPKFALHFSSVNTNPINYL